MAHIVNKDYTEIAADGTSYLTWTMDFKIMPPAHVLDTTKLCMIRLLETPYLPRSQDIGKRSTQTLGCTQRIL